MGPPALRIVGSVVVAPTRYPEIAGSKPAIVKGYAFKQNIT